MEKLEFGSGVTRFEIVPCILLVNNEYIRTTQAFFDVVFYISVRVQSLPFLFELFLFAIHSILHYSYGYFLL
jgi:hypothetical protein